MLELGVAFFVGLMVGWHVPAPAWATKLWDMFKSKTE